MTSIPLLDRALTTEEIIPLMFQHNLMPQLLRSLILDRTLADVQLSEAERDEFAAQQDLANAAAQQAWLQQQGMTPDQFATWLDRQGKIAKFQQQTWGRKLQAYFLSRKAQLDCVVCSLIHVQDLDTAWELYFRIAEGEQSFAEVALSYSQGQETYTGGIVGPIELGNLHTELSSRFYGAQPGHLWEPLRVGEWFVIARLEKHLPVQFDAEMQRYLLNELLESWLQEQVNTWQQSLALQNSTADRAP